MPEYQYTTVPGKIKEFLKKIREVGVPSRVTQQWLTTIGFKTKNDRSLIGVIRAIGFIDATNAPTNLWSQFRGANHKQVLAQGIKLAYTELFRLYEDAWKRNSSELENVFSASTTAGKQVVQKIVSTFKSLCELADFESSNTVSTPTTEENLHISSGPLHTPVAEAAPPRAGIGGSPSVHIDVQIHISPEATAEQIDQIFASMSKHLYKN